MKKHKYFINNNNKIEDLYQKINKKYEYIDILKLHGLGFYKKYNIDPLKTDKNPEWFIKFSNNIINTLIIDNFYKISFNSTGFKLIKNIIDNNKIIINDENKIIKTITLEEDNELELILIIDNKFYQLQQYIKNKEEYKNYYINNIEVLF